jgi:hypothetical protein
LPELQLFGCPEVQQYVSLRLVHALGGAPLFFFFGVNGRADVTLRGSDFLVAGPLTLLPPFPVPGNGPGEGELYASLFLGDPVLAGLRVNMQGFLLDPGAPEGLAATNGLEFTVGE